MRWLKGRQARADCVPGRTNRITDASDTVLNRSVSIGENVTQSRAAEKPRLLYVANVAWYFRSHRMAIAEAALAEGWDVHLAAPESADRAAIETAGITYHAAAMSRAGLHPLDNLRSLIALYRVCRLVRPDVVHLIALKAIVLGGTAARLADRRGRILAIAGLGHVFSERGVRGRALRFAFRLLLPWLVGRAGRLIGQHQSDLSNAGFTPGLARRGVLIPGSGVDLGRFRPRPEPEGPVTVVVASRMIWKKGIADAVAAVELLRKQGRDVRLWLVGAPDEGNPDAISCQQLRAWQAAGAAKWLGYRTDIAEVLAQAHIVCLPSYYGEGVPKTLLEAAAAGRAVITTDHPGCRNAVVENRTALLVRPRAPDALAKAIARLADDRELRRRMGAAGRQLAKERFSIDAVVQQHLALYAEVQRGKEAKQGMTG